MECKGGGWMSARKNIIAKCSSGMKKDVEDKSREEQEIEIIIISWKK